MKLIALATLLWAQDSDAERIRTRYDALRPKEHELSLFKLDWVVTLKAAKEKAAREGRPIFVITVENEHGGLYGGHC